MFCLGMRKLLKNENWFKVEFLLVTDYLSNRLGWEEEVENT